MNSNIVKALLLFVSAAILIQVFYGVEAGTNFFQSDQYFPYGYAIHILYYLSILAVTFLFLGKISFAAVNLKRTSGLKKFIFIGLGLGLLGFLLRVLFIPGTFGSSFYPIPYYLLVPAFVFLGLLIGLAEESVFRGFILKNFLEKYGPILAIILSSFLFCIYHINFLDLNSSSAYFWTLYVDQAFTGGIIMALLYYKTGRNLTSSIAYHSTNIIAGQIFLWTPNPEATYVLGVETIINIVLVVWLYFLPIDTKKEKEIVSARTRHYSGNYFPDIPESL